jgi:hypothetical protein
MIKVAAYALTHILAIEHSARVTLFEEFTFYGMREGGFPRA